KAVPAEATRDEEPPHAGRPADDGVIVRRERTQPGPAAGDARLLDDRDAVQRLLDGLADARAVHRHAEALADIFHVAGREQELLHLLAEVEAAGAVGGERHRARDLRERLRVEDVAAPRRHGQLYAGEAADGRAGRTGRVDHDRRRDRALAR